MSRLILPGEAQRPRDSLQILVPCGYENGEVVVVGHCLICECKFYAGEEQAWQRHVGRCARENMDSIQQASLKQRMPVFDEETWDPEVQEHLKNGAGRRMREAVDKLGVARAIRDGHMEARPNEKAGL